MTTNIEQIVQGAKKHAKRQRYRERKTRFGLGSGKRNVLDEFPEIAVEDDTKILESHEHRKQRDIVTRQIEEFAASAVDRELVLRRLFEGAPIKVLAEQFSLNYSTARSKINRAERYLGLRE